MADKINLAVVGSGYWGPNLIRNIAGLPDAALHTVCDLNPKALANNAQRYPGVKTTPNLPRCWLIPKFRASCWQRRRICTPRWVSKRWRQASI